MKRSMLEWRDEVPKVFLLIPKSEEWIKVTVNLKFSYHFYYLFEHYGNLGIRCPLQFIVGASLDQVLKLKWITNLGYHTNIIFWMDTNSGLAVEELSRVFTIPLYYFLDGVGFYLLVDWKLKGLQEY